VEVIRRVRGLGVSRRDFVFISSLSVLDPLMRLIFSCRGDRVVVNMCIGGSMIIGRNDF
jgi:hypothetical protein